MAVTSEYQPVRFKGDGTRSRFDFPFRIFAQTDLQVYVNGELQPLGTAYDVKSDISLPNGSYYDWRHGGYVLFMPGYIPAQDADVVIHRVIPVMQFLDLEEGGPLPPEMLESSLDRITYIVQQIDNAVRRCLLSPITMGQDFDFTMPTPKPYTVLGISVDGKSFTLYEYSLKLQYSPNLTDWYGESSLSRNDRYIRISIDGGKTWGSPVDLNALQNLMLHETLIARGDAVEAKDIALAAASSANQAKEDAIEAKDLTLAAAHVLPWDESKTYSFPDLVARPDGHTYRCIGENIKGLPFPESSPFWVCITTFVSMDIGDEWIDGLGFEDINPEDIFGDGGTF